MERIQKLKYDISDKIQFPLMLILGLQHVFAMFGATILVPILTGMSVSTALFASGIGTFIYVTVTKNKVPVYLGSSFAYITATIFAVKSMNGDISGAQNGLILIGITYLIVAFIIKLVGKTWLDKLLPPVIIGSMILVIGLSLSATAVKNASLITGGDYRQIIVALVAFITAALISVKAKNFLSIVPFLVAIIVGYIVAIFLGLVDFQPVIDAPLFALPDWSIVGKDFKFDLFNPIALSMLPIAFVTISEHIGDHLVLSKVTGKNFLKNPGLEYTLAGDGLATMVSAMIGGPANTTYGENTAVIAMTKVASISVIKTAAFFAIILSFCAKISAIIQTIPLGVLGGMSILLYGVIASNGLKVMVENKVDFHDSKNLVIASAMLVLGLGGAMLQLHPNFIISSTALSAIVGIILNLILNTNKNIEF